MQIFNPLLTGDERSTWRLPFVRVVEGFMDDAFCQRLLERIATLGPTAAPVTTRTGAVMRQDIRNNERVMFDDEALARTLFERARSVLPETLRGGPRTTDRDGPTWRVSGLNERFRGYRYGPGQRFTPHFDGCFARSKDEQSAITFLVYLDGDCEGGETRLLDYGVTVRPTKGLLLMFDHYVLHEGATVTAGVKHVLRSDVMYSRES